MMDGMNRAEIAPIAALQPIVKSFWYLEGAQEVYNRHSIYPDSYREIIISLGAPLGVQNTDGSWLELPHAYISPLQTAPQRLRALGQCEIIAISVYPWAISALDQYAAANQLDFIPLNSAWQRFTDTITLTVRRDGYAEGIAQLQQFASDQWTSAPRDFEAISAAGRLIYSQRGQLSLLDLAARCYLSPSQLERRFKTLTGVTPKSYARLVRYESIRNAILINPSRCLADMASEYGYTDQAHFTHDFKTFTARTPGQFAAEVKKYTARWQPADFLQYA